MIYKHILKPIFFLFDPEHVHDFMIKVGMILGSFSITRWITGFFYDYRGPNISKTVDGITYRTPFLLSAGFDYNGHLTKILSHIGMGGEEIGSVTARPCDGNPKPRLTRLPRSKSILVNKGLKNDGVDVIMKRLLERRGLYNSEASPLGARGSDVTSEPRLVVGISIARTNCLESSSVEAGIEDYLYSFKRLNEENIGDYYTINISCPNAFGGETFTKPELLTRLLLALNKVRYYEARPLQTRGEASANTRRGLDEDEASPRSLKPVYVKMPINISWEQFASLLKVIDSFGLNGVVIGNLNKDYNYLDVRKEAPEQYCGGLSGKPCANLSTALIRKTRELYGKRFTIIGVGGVMSPETAMEKFEAGADLVQLITGMIYEGPGLIKELGNAYSKMKSATVV